MVHYGLTVARNLVQKTVSIDFHQPSVLGGLMPNFYSVVRLIVKLLDQWLDIS